MINYSLQGWVCLHIRPKQLLLKAIRFALCLMDFLWADSYLQTGYIGELLKPGMQIMDKTGNKATYFACIKYLACQSFPFSPCILPPVSTLAGHKINPELLAPRVSQRCCAEFCNLWKIQVLNALLMPKRWYEGLVHPILERRNFVLLLLCISSSGDPHWILKWGRIYIII